MQTNPLPLVLLTHKLPEDWITSLSGKCQLLIGPIDATFLDRHLDAHIDEAIGLFTLLTITVDTPLLHKAQRLRVISNMAVGVDNIDVSTCTKRKIPVGNTPGVLTEGTADLTMGLLLSIARGLPWAREDAMAGKWKTWSPTGWLGADLNGATLGIIGFGKIGQAVAQRAQGFGMRVVYTDPDRVSSNLGLHLSLSDLLHQSDFVSLHVPLTKETYHLMDSCKLALMKQGAFLINASRGAVIDTEALCLALVQGMIAGAALDVTDPEPLPQDHPLYKLPNCLILPHIGSATQNTRRKMAELACENLIAGLEGRRLPHCVNPEVYEI